MSNVGYIIGYVGSTISKINESVVYLSISHKKMVKQIKCSTSNYALIEKIKALKNGDFVRITSSIDVTQDNYYNLDIVQIDLI